MIPDETLKRPVPRDQGRGLKKVLALAATIALLASLLAQPKPDAKPFKVSIVHTNDWHANHQPQRKGDGGSARQTSVIKRIKAEVKNVLLLDAGDRFTGTILHQKGGQENVPLMNALGFHAMTLGNHEFDDGDEQLALFAKRVAFPLVSANVDVSKSPDLRDLIKPYAIIEVGGQKFGVIGLTTANAKTNSRPGKNLEFDRDYAARVQAAVAELDRAGVNKIVVLSHIGFDEDQKLAAQVSKVDVIVGGHSHTVLSNLYKEAKAVYPVSVLDKDGKPVYIVQAGGGDGRFIGKLDLEFNVAGHVVKAGGDCIHLSSFIPQDVETQTGIDKMQKDIDSSLTKPILTADGKIAEAADDFPGDKVRSEETAIGDLATDALRKRAAADIAIINGGSIRAGLAAGQVTRAAVRGAFPYDNTLHLVRLKGSVIIEAIEHGLSTFTVESDKGRFLQVSGMQFTFDPKQPVGRRVLRVEVLSGNQFEALDPARIYKVAFDSFLWGGGDDFTMLSRKAEAAEDLGYPVRDIVEQFIADHSPVRARIEGRIKR